MLRFTKRLDYGLIAMHYIAADQGNRATGVKRIADEFQIPPERLAKILQRLAKGGLMVSQSGPHGGYRPALPPSEVTIGQVIRILEGPVAIVSCLAKHDDCAQMSRCTVRQPARKIQAAIAAMLDTMTLAELIGDDVAAPLAGQ